VLSAFLERCARSKVLAVGCSALLVAGLATASVTAIGAAASTSLLPGETTWDNGTPSYIFGTNDTIDYGSPNVDDTPSVQSLLKQGGLTLDRIWAYDSAPTSTPAEIQAKIQAGINAGMTCFFMLGQTDELAWLESTVELAEPMGCHIFEFGNEPDNGGSPANGSISTYTAQWNADVPVLRGLSVCQATNACVFGGPAAIYPSDTQSFISHTAATRPDFISIHDYPCNGAEAWDSNETQAMEDCLNHMTNDNAGYGAGSGQQARGTCTLTPGSCTISANGSWGVDQSNALGWESKYYGTTVPTGISEYNFDPGSGTLNDWGTNDQFLYAWQVAAMDSFVFNHMAFATQFTTLNYSGYGLLDMFCDGKGFNNDPACTAVGSPKGQFYGMVSEVKKYGGPSTLAIPNPLP
jgi:hypothetical protein